MFISSAPQHDRSTSLNPNSRDFPIIFLIEFLRIFDKQMWPYGLKEKDLLIYVVDPEKFIISLIWFS